jgi:alanyl-tRNA synthetase
MTDKLFYDDPNRIEFKAKLVSSTSFGDRYGAILDRTCFYPEGGGQPADTGWLNDIRVIDVQKQDEQIIHFTEKPVSDKLVVGKIDKDRRLDFMQQHTGQHVLSQALLRIGGYNTVSVHMGESYLAIEVDAESIPEEKLVEVEILANEIVNNNLPIKIHWIDASQVDHYKIRRPPPDVERIRLIEVEGFDVAACGGLHVSRTGRIGLIKIIALEKIRARTRIHALIGNRAYQDYDNKLRLIQALMQSLTCGEKDILRRVEDLERQLKEIKASNFKLESEFMVMIAEKDLRKAEEINGKKFHYRIFENTDRNLLRSYVDEILKKSDRIVVAFNISGEKIQWIIAHSLLTEMNLPLVIKPLLSVIDGKGGGSGNFVQGGGNKLSGISEFIEKFKHTLKEELI